MKKTLSKTEANEKIQSFFQKDFSSIEMKKIKRVASKYRISLKNYKKKFCKKCLNMLKGKIRVSKNHKSITCSSCKYVNKFAFVNVK